MRLYSLNLYPNYVDREVLQRTQNKPHNAFIVADSQTNAMNEIYTDMCTEFWLWDGAIAGGCLHAIKINMFAPNEDAFEEGIILLATTLGMLKPQVYSGDNWPQAQSDALRDDALRIANMQAESNNDSNGNSNGNGNKGKLKPNRKAVAGGGCKEMER